MKQKNERIETMDGRLLVSTCFAWALRWAQMIEPPFLPPLFVLPLLQIINVAVGVIYRLHQVTSVL